MTKIALTCLLLFMTEQILVAETLRVPQEHKSIQAAIDASAPGDTIIVSPGLYHERIRLKPKISLRSLGNDSRGTEGLKRAEMVTLDGGGKNGKSAGVMMAPGATLDGFTIRNVGFYDDAEWNKHFDSHGELLRDDQGSVQAEGTTPAISIQGVSCTVTNCIVHHNGDVGIAVMGKVAAKTAPNINNNIVYRNMGSGIGVAEGAEPIVRRNRCSENLRAGIGCRSAYPMILDNWCFKNVRAGIGCREGSKPIIRGNQCYQNRRAGIGIRMKGTDCIVEDNECLENDMAGIGCRNEASPTLRNNVCRKNKMAGIGCDGAFPIIIGNECAQNELAGIGVRGQSKVVIQGNTCHDNKLVAIGITQGSTATIIKNEVSRTGGMPPIIAVKDDSIALIRDNQISGGGVAAVLVQGRATLSKNKFFGKGDKQGNAVWIWEGSSATIADNSFAGFRTAVTATKANVVISGNKISRFQGTAIVVKESKQPAHIYQNTGISTDPNAKVIDVSGATGLIESNVLQKK